MEILLLGIYCFFVWLIFIQFKLLPWTTPWKVAVAILPVVALTAMILLLCLYTVLAIFMPAYLEGRANPAVTPTGSKPAWYFLFLYQYLHFVPPLVGTITPVLLLVLLGAWPWIDAGAAARATGRVAGHDLGQHDGRLEREGVPPVR